jgi:uncharacterized protein involved in exopolysaccharide biosynthesis
VSRSRSLVGEGLRLAWRHRWTFGIPVATLVFAATLWAVHQPDVYRASATVYVTRVNPERVGSALTQGEEARSEQMIANARDRVLAQQNVVAMLEVLQPDSPADDPVVRTRAKERVRFDQVGDTAFRLSIEDPSPDRAAKAVNTLVASFLAAERGGRVRKARDRADFLRGEADAAGALASAHRATMDRWRAEHRDFDRRESLAADLARVESAARDKEAQATNARRLLQEYEKLIRQPAAPGNTAPAPQSAEEEQLSLKLRGQQAVLEGAQKSLVDLRSRYQDRWPAIQETLAQIRGLEADLEKTKRDLDAARLSASKTLAQRRLSESQGMLQTLEALKRSVGEEGTALDAQAAKLRAEVGDLQRRRADADALVPDHARLRDDMVTARERAERAVNEAALAAKAAQYAATGPDEEVTGFRVDEQAVPPALPSGPGRGKLLASAVVLGLGLAWLVLVLRRRVEGTEVDEPDDLADLVPGALVVEVPLLADPSRRRVHLVREALAAGWVGLCLLGSLFAIAAYKGWIATPDWFRPWIGGGA